MSLLPIQSSVQSPIQSSVQNVVSLQQPNKRWVRPSISAQKLGSSSRFSAVLPWILPTALLVIWQVAAQTGRLPHKILPTPSTVAASALHLAQSGELVRHLMISTQRAMVGLLLGGTLGLAFGMITGLSRLAERLLDSSVQMLRTIPSLAMIPLIILWLGVGEEAKILLIALGVFFPLYLNTLHGVRNVDQGLKEMATVYGLRGWRLFREVILPGALPSILVGLRYALGTMWLTLIAAEALAAESGIGYMTTTAREFMQTDIVVIGILLYALLGKLADVIARALEVRLLHWNASYQKR